MTVAEFRGKRIWFNNDTRKWVSGDRDVQAIVNADLPDFYSFTPDPGREALALLQELAGSQVKVIEVDPIEDTDDDKVY